MWGCVDNKDFDLLNQALKENINNVSDYMKLPLRLLRNIWIMYIIPSTMIIQTAF